MYDFGRWDGQLQRLYEAYAVLGADPIYEKWEPATEGEIFELQARMDRSLPESLKKVLTGFSKQLTFRAQLPEEFRLPDELRDVFRASIEYSLASIAEAEMERREWTRECFSDPGDRYGGVWHDKLGFMNVPNGDVIAFDFADPLDDKRVMYLSHDDGEGHGAILAANFGEYIESLIAIGGCGNEDWQMLPFIDDPLLGINPRCANAKRYREVIAYEWSPYAF